MKNLLVAISMILVFGLGLVMYTNWIFNLSQGIPTVSSVLGYIGLVLMVITIIGSFVCLVQSKTLFKNNFDKGVALCAYASIGGFIPALIKVGLARESITIGVDLQFGIAVHMVLFAIIAAASAGAGGSLIAADVVLNKDKQ